MSIDYEALAMAESYWNRAADENNQWDTLDFDEKLGLYESAKQPTTEQPDETLLEAAKFAAENWNNPASKRLLREALSKLPKRETVEQPPTEKVGDGERESGDECIRDILLENNSHGSTDYKSGFSSGLQAAIKVFRRHYGRL